MPNLPPDTSLGWELKDGNMSPVLLSLADVPESCLQLITCGCQTRCSTRKCKCVKSRLTCTGNCRCTADCMNADHWTQSLLVWQYNYLVNICDYNTIPYSIPLKSFTCLFLELRWQGNRHISHATEKCGIYGIYIYASFLSFNKIKSFWAVI